MSITDSSDSEGVETTCHNCGHEWTYTGEKAGDMPITCPDCTYKTYPGDKSSNAKPRHGPTLRCQSCGNEWTYTGDKDKYCDCPVCRRNVIIEEAKV